MLGPQKPGEGAWLHQYLYCQIQGNMFECLLIRTVSPLLFGGNNRTLELSDRQTRWVLPKMLKLAEAPDLTESEKVDDTLRSTKIWNTGMSGPFSQIKGNYTIIHNNVWSKSWFSSEWPSEANSTPQTESLFTRREILRRAINSIISCIVNMRESSSAREGGGKINVLEDVLPRKSMWKMTLLHLHQTLLNTDIGAENAKRWAKTWKWTCSWLPWLPTSDLLDYDNILTERTTLRSLCVQQEGLLKDELIYILF